MNYSCAECRKVVAKEDRRRKIPELVAVSGASVERHHQQAPRLRCPCGHVTILIRGRA